MLDFRLYMAQRLTALIMAPLVLGHIAVMIYAIQGGLSSAEILGRTQGSLFWLLFYGLFVLAVSIHAAISAVAPAPFSLIASGIQIDSHTSQLRPASSIRA